MEVVVLPDMGADHTAATLLKYDSDVSSPGLFSFD